MSPWLSELFLRSQSDERLVMLAREGNETAFTTIVERYRRALQAYARRLDPARAEDLVQQTFLCAFKALQSDTEVRHLRGWLYQILRHVAARGVVTGGFQEELAEPEPVSESAQQVAERRMLVRDSLAAAAQLPAHQHEALIQTAVHGLSRSEVAEAMGLTEGAVRQLVHRARATVRAAVTALTPLPLVRWFSAGRSSAGPGLAEMSIAGTASGTGIAVKIGAGVVLATGVATGVVSTVVPHHAPARPTVIRAVASTVSPSPGHGDSGRGGGDRTSGSPGATTPSGFQGSRRNRTGAVRSGRGSTGASSGTSSHGRGDRSTGFGGQSGPDGRGSGSGSGSDGGSHSGAGSNGGSGSGSDGGSGSGGGGGSGASGSGDGHRGGGSDGSGTSGSSGSGDGGGTQIGTTSGDGGGTSSGSDGGSSGSGGSGSGGGLHVDGSGGSGSGDQSSGSGSAGNSSDGGSGASNGLSSQSTTEGR